MKRLFILMLAGLCTPASAQLTPQFRSAGAVTDSNPQPVQLRCWSGSAWVPCPLNAGGGGGPVNADGAIQAVPAGSTNGTALPGRPASASGVIFDMASGDSITYTIATAAPSAAPTQTITVTGTQYARWTEQLGPNTNIYITARTGAPKFRWL